MRAIFIVLCCFFLFACTEFENSPYSSPKFSYWPGKNVNLLTTEWGRPNRITTAFNGNWEYVYYARNLQPKSAVAPTRTLAFAGPKNTSYGVNVPAQGTNAPELIACEAIFEVNPRNLILSVRENGAGCNGDVVWPGKM